VLVLGSVPSVASLRAARYYAHPRNAFWPIMGALCSAGPELSYADRAARLRGAGVALWDVLHRCVRPGSLDSDIDPTSIEPNDFRAFFIRHPRIGAVFCNGGAAYACYRRHVLPGLSPAATDLPLVQLPSTSPAHAARTGEQKLAIWRAALAPFLAQRPPSRGRTFLNRRRRT
jgi:hypoxanthine-DNA glycosylase